LLLYYITDRKQFRSTAAEQRTRLLGCIGVAAAAGVDYVQLREKDLSARELEGLARGAVDAIAGTTTKLLVNGRVDIAIAAGAHGVHLPGGAGELSASEARVIFGKARVADPVIAVSCHTATEVAYAEAHGADFVVFGPVFEKNGISDLAGLTRLAPVCNRAEGANSRMPVLALGGVTLENADAAMRAGASGVAGIRLFQNAADVSAVIRRLRASAVAPRSASFRHPYQL
jgi:thiamine-phosphate pyrophosphorylase